MNQSIGKLSNQEGQDDKAKNHLENLSNKAEDSTTVERKEIMKNNTNTSPTRINKDKLAETNRKDEPKLKKSNPTKAFNNNTNKSNKPVSHLPKKTPPPRVSLAPNPKAFSPASSRIPALKQMTNPKTNIKNNKNARSAAPEQTGTQLPPSDSKASINTVSKVESSTSRSMRNPISHSARAKDNMKIQTARSAATTGPSVQKRSASNMSTRSTPPPLVKREETQTNLRQITSIAGDYVKPNNIMASNKSSRSTSPAKKQQPETNLRKMLSTAGDQNKIESLEKKLEEAQTEFLMKMENLKDNLPEILKYEYKFLTVTRNDELKLMVKDDGLLKLAPTFPDAVIDFKEKIKKCMDNYFASLMDNLKETNDDSTPIDIEAKDKLEKLQILKSNNILSLIDDLCSIQEEGFDAQLVKMQKELQDSNTSYRELEKTLNNLSKNHEEALFNLGKDMQMKADADLAHKDTEMKELSKKLKWLEKQLDNSKAAERDDKADKSHMQEEIKTSKDSYATLQKRLHSLEHQLTNEKKELKSKNDTIKKLENDLVDKRKLETNLADMTLKVQELQLELQDKPQQTSCSESNNCAEHLQQLAELQNNVNCLEAEKNKMEIKTEKLEAEVAALVVVQAKLKDAENCIKDLQRKLDTKETSQDTQADYAKDVQLEFAKFRQSDAEKRREIEKLKVELSKFQYNICQLEEEIQRGQQLLEVRCELINSLQTNEKTQRIHMEELFAQVAEKNNTINELNGELHTKTEEFRNLFSTISAKQMELSNQEHMIKLLEDSNERSQMLRVKQEEKIGRMEEELAHLKQTISIYQANILSGNHGKNVLYAPILPASNGEINENFYYYASQRRRKRQVDINVKKYEA